jgi:hypothetical protein
MPPDGALFNRIVIISDAGRITPGCLLGQTDGLAEGIVGGD